MENAGGIGRYAGALSKTGLRRVFAESIRDSENVPGPLSPEGLAKSEAPRFSQKLRDDGVERIADLFSAWHGKNQGRISVFPAAALTETSPPELLRAVRAFADKHDSAYTIHLNQSIAEYQFMEKFHGMRPAAYLERHGFLGPRLFAAHARYVDAGEIALLGKTRTIISHQANMAANRGVIPPIPALREAGCPIALGAERIIDGEVRCQNMDHWYRQHRRRDLRLHRDVVEAPDLIEQPREDRGHPCLARRGGQVEDAEVLDVDALAVGPHQRVVGAAECDGGIQVFAIPVPRKGAGRTNHPITCR